MAFVNIYWLLLGSRRSVKLYFRTSTELQCCEGLCVWESQHCETYIHKNEQIHSCLPIDCRHLRHSKVLGGQSSCADNRYIPFLLRHDVWRYGPWLHPVFGCRTTRIIWSKHEKRDSWINYGCKISFVVDGTSCFLLWFYLQWVLCGHNKYIWILLLIQ